MIFREASTVLQGIRTPPCKSLSNSKASRLPLSQARSMKFGSVGCDETHMNIDLGSPNESKIDREPRFETRGDQPDAHTFPNIPIGQPSSAHFPKEQADVVIDDSKSEYSCRLPNLPATSSPVPLPLAFTTSEGSHPEDEEKEPISSGFATPSAKYSQPVPTPEEVQYPDLEHWHLPQSSSNGDVISWSGSRPLQPNQFSSPVLLSQRPRIENVQSAEIESWLNGIQRSPRAVRQPEVRQGSVFADEITTMKVTSPQSRSSRKYTKPEEPQFFSRTSSNKENISPVTNPSSPVHHGPLYLTTTPSRFRNSNVQTVRDPKSPLPFPHPLTPQGHLSLPPIRKRPRYGNETISAHSKSGKDFTIHDDQLAGALAQLSPDVELRRKGRRPKRERCVSYWDEDILSPSSPCLPAETEVNSGSIRKGKRVLGESQSTAELTTERPFFAEAEDAKFHFQVEKS